MHRQSDVVIVGSGPYGLSLAAHLRARGVDFRIFGQPMKFWRDMPRGINLKSFAFATNVVVPAKGNTFPEWCRANNLEDFEPCSMESFAAYGMWIKERFVPEAESVEVKRVALGPGGRFDIELANEERLQARRVVFSTGLSYFAQTPEPCAGLPTALVSHTFDLSDYSHFRGKDVAVLGAGASAVEAGALVHEAGGRASLFAREDGVIFHGRLAAKRSLYHRIRYPNSVFGPGMTNRMIQLFPLAVYFLPDGRRIRLVKKHLGPAAPWWIQDRVEGHVPIFGRTQLVTAEPVGAKLRLQFREDGGGARTLEVDHLIAGTGYIADVDRLTYLDEDLRRRIRRLERAPRLSVNFESSVPGTYFLGPAAAMSFGPLYRFVAGAEYAAPALANHLANADGTMLRSVMRWASGAKGGRADAGEGRDTSRAA